ncbi:retrovirus-related pol polyprotein from transposon TNT 1-94 [Tanacetum coccineum]
MRGYELTLTGKLMMAKVYQVKVRLCQQPGLWKYCITVRAIIIQRSCSKRLRSHDTLNLFTTTVPLPPPFFNPLQQEATPTTSEATTSTPALSDFAFVFKFNKRVTNLEKDLQEARDEKNEYIGLVYTSMRTIIREEVTTQLPQILPQAVSDFAIPAIEKNVVESLEAAVLTKSSSQPQSTYEAAAALFEFELTKILIDKMEKNKSYDKADYKKELYNVLITSYQTDKDLFDTYGEVFLLKRSRDNRDKDQDPSAGSDRRTKRRKSSKDAESSQESRSKEKKSSSTTKGTSHSQHKNSGKSAHAEEPKLDYHLEECSKATTEQLDWHKPEGKPYPFDLSKPLPLIPDHRGLQIIPHDFFINNDLEYLKGGDLSRRYSTFVTKTKAVTYEIKWIEDLVCNLWSPVKVIYDKHAYWGISYWGPKRQHFYRFAANMNSSKDVYSRKRIIMVTKLSIMEKYDYGHLEEIKVRREDQKLYKFREGSLNVLSCGYDVMVDSRMRVLGIKYDAFSYEVQALIHRIFFAGYDVLRNLRSKFTYENLVETTNGFSPLNLLGSGGFGFVYISGSDDGTDYGEVAVVKEFKDDVPVVEPNQHDDVPVILEPVLEDKDEDLKEEEFEEEEEDPQEEEDDIEVDIEEDENEPELTYPYEEVDPLNPSSPAFESEPDEEIKVENLIEHEDETVSVSVYEVGESSTIAIP